MHDSNLVSVTDGDGITGHLAYNARNELASATKRASTLTRQLLAFSRKQIIRPRAVNVARALRRLQRMLLRTLGEDVTLAPAVGVLPSITVTLSTNRLAT